MLFGRKQFRKNVTSIIYSFIISIIFFYLINVTFKVYAVVIVFIWLIILINFRIDNRALYVNAILFGALNLIAQIVVKYLTYSKINIDLCNISFCVAYSIFLIIIMVLSITKKIKEEIPETHEIFLRRKYDLERVCHYVESFNIIGVNGKWGSGKSVLIDELKTNPDIYEKYVIIEIDLLSCNLDEIQKILLSELEKVLSNDRVFSRYSNMLKRMLEEKKLLQGIRGLFWTEDLSYSEALVGFKRELFALDKSIIVVYEDIDRINDINVIKKIFSISEKLSGNKIKIIYQYDEANINDLGFDRNYLEKYIPYTVKLTDIEFFEELEDLYIDLHIDKSLLTLDDFHYLNMPLHGDYYTMNILNLNQSFNIKIDCSIRKVKDFLLELQSSLKRNAIYREELNKKMIISFYFIKHFFNHIYEQLNLGNGLIETLKFEYNDKNYTVLEIISMCKNHKETNGEQGLSQEDVASIFKVQKNIDFYATLALFDYNFNIDEVKHNFDDIMNEPVKNITNYNANEKKDRLIWNLLCNGKSEYTDYENAVRKFINNVLDKPEHEQKAAFLAFFDDMFYGKNEKKDNNTIFRFGLSVFIPLLRAFRVIGATKENWCGLIDLYFREEKCKEIDVKLIDHLKYCSLEDKIVYLDILERFNKLDIIGNMNNNKCYKVFLKDYLRALSSLQYINTEEVWILDDSEDSIKRPEFVCHALKDMINKIQKLKKEIKILKIQEELNIIIAFILKNIDIINAPNALSAKHPRVHTEVSSHFSNQQEYDRLKELKLKQKERLEEIEKSYERGNISVNEIYNLLKKN